MQGEDLVVGLDRAKDVEKRDLLGVDQQRPASADSRFRLDKTGGAQSTEQSPNHHWVGVYTAPDEFRGQRLVGLQREDRHDVNADAQF
jgi:hypothetical protein